MANPASSLDTQSKPFELLCESFGLSFPSIAAARNATDRRVAELRDALQGSGIELGETLSLLVFGSIARREWTTGSDVDWTLLVDGPVDAKHLKTANQIAKMFKSAGLPTPGPTGIFGALASSHDLVHHVGGMEDTNRNMTRRLLLLLESQSVGGDVVRDRVIRAVLERYIVYGRGVTDETKPGLHVPRFLFNDVVRYWRTIAVDYAAKKWQKGDEAWGLRNAKLRVSRKMTFIKGLLLCFDCELFVNTSPWAELTSSELPEKRLVSGCSSLVEMPPIDLLSRLLLITNLRDSADRLFSAYDSFLELIGDIKSRAHLEELTFDQASSDPLFQRVRKEIGQVFADELEKLFFKSYELLTDLTQKYGVF